MKYLTYNGKRVLNNGQTIVKPLTIYPIKNAGAPGTTDWVDSNSDSVPDNWDFIQDGNADSSINTSSGFSGNVLKLYKDVGTGGGTTSRIISDTFPTSPNTTYTLSAKVKLNNINNSDTGTIQVLNSSQTVVASITISYVTLTPGEVTDVSVEFTTDSVSSIRFNTAFFNDGASIEIDDLELRYY